MLRLIKSLGKAKNLFKAIKTVSYCRLNVHFVSLGMDKKQSEAGKSKAKGYQEERHPTIVNLDTYLKDDKSLSVKAVCNILNEAYNVGNEYSENVWYQRILKLRTGEYKTATPEELSAIARLLHVEANRHQYGSLIHNLGQIERKINQIDTFLKSGHINRTEAAKRVKELKTLIPLSVTHTQENN